MKYSGNIKVAFKQGLASRAINLMWVLSKPILILVSIIVWTSIYNYSGKGLIGGFTIDETINYMMFSIVFGAITYTRVGQKIGSDILNGNLSTKLIRPVNYGIEYLLRNIGNRLYALIFEVLPGLIIAVTFFGFHSFNLLMTIISFISICLGLLINFFVSINWALMYFNTKAFQPLEELKRRLVNFFAGVYMPLNFMPLALQKIFNYLPFQFIIYIPSRIFINSYSLSQALIFMAIQAGWIVLLYSTYRVGWHHSIKNFSGAGI